MAHAEETIQINAPPEKVWAVLADVERWPEWTQSMRSVERLESGDFGMGSGARLHIKGGRPSVWRVTRWEPGTRFVWEMRSPGIHGVADHVVEPDGDGSKVTLSAELSGILATLLAPMINPISRRNVRMEAEGLKRRAESASG